MTTQAVPSRGPASLAGAGRRIFRQADDHETSVRVSVWGLFFFCLHTAFKLNSLWHVGYLPDNLCDFYLCSRLDFYSYSSARRPDFTKPPPLLGFVPSYFPAFLTLHLPPHSPPSSGITSASSDL
jgi:hypothetical protein